MIPLYILGLLLRFGPQHGYQIKKLMEEQLEDFTQIKLPTVYYHLEKMEAAKLLTATRDKQGARPEKTVYQVSDTGVDKFRELLVQTLQIEYRPTFDIDGTFYFSDSLGSDALLNSLSKHITSLKKTLDGLEAHRKATVEHIPKDYQISADIIFEHHILHYRAELTWAEQSWNTLKEVEEHGKKQSY
ncbi:DNA-binding PadR family transcriptional regulator [Kineothrix alysoides]|uniref:DNA-binding PadR family transcriptional regulator n=1 Tax=Kineothrix alysoides TaxID=1469948 RepID=A0A4R1QNB8_9FIRM|nr:PadR family transcriptional regulator [Kineothrix alysoides]TCL55248.1 DNA-binding PadR family transcriptional regulator [Kineothrix alysoides]